MTGKYEEAVIRLWAAMLERHAAEIAAVEGLYERAGMSLPDKKYDFPPMSEKKWAIAEVEDVLKAALEWFDAIRGKGLGSDRWSLAEADLYRAILKMVGLPEKATTEGGGATE